MSRINNVAELQAEIQRLQKAGREQKEKINNDIKEIGEELKPANLLMSAVSSFFGIRIEKNEFIKGGITLGIALIIQRFILKTETTSGNKVFEWVDTILERIQGFVNQFKTSPAQEEEENKRAG